MKYILALILTLLAAQEARSQNAAGVVTSSISNNGNVEVQISVSEPTGTVSFSTSFNVNFASSPNQINADIKQKIRDILLQYGVNVPVNSILLFGGAQ